MNDYIRSSGIYEFKEWELDLLFSENEHELSVFENKYGIKLGLLVETYVESPVWNANYPLYKYRNHKGTPTQRLKALRDFISYTFLQGVSTYFIPRDYEERNSFFKSSLFNSRWVVQEIFSVYSKPGTPFLVNAHSPYEALVKSFSKIIPHLFPLSFRLLKENKGCEEVWIAEYNINSGVAHIWERDDSGKYIINKILHAPIYKADSFFHKYYIRSFRNWKVFHRDFLKSHSITILKPFTVGASSFYRKLRRK